jgi:RNA-binding protein
VSVKELTSKQRAYLRSLANRLKPVVFIGVGGVTAEVVRSVEEAFNSRELLKVKVLQGAPEKARPTAASLMAALEDVQVPQTIGRTIVLYRPFPKDPEIEFPG